MSENLTHMSALGNDFIVIDAISNQWDLSKMIKNELETPVSYTHLTLPTICSV